MRSNGIYRILNTWFKDVVTNHACYIRLWQANGNNRLIGSEGYITGSNFTYVVVSGSVSVNTKDYYFGVPGSAIGTSSIAYIDAFISNGTEIQPTDVYIGTQEITGSASVSAAQTFKFQGMTIRLDAEVTNPYLTDISAS